MQNYYLILGLDEDADFSTIKSAYRDLCKNCHPDTSSCDGEEFRTIHDAYEVLSEPRRRREYDRELSHLRGRRSSPAEAGESIPICRDGPSSSQKKRFTGRGDSGKTTFSPGFLPFSIVCFLSPLLPLLDVLTFGSANTCLPEECIEKTSLLP